MVSIEYHSFHPPLEQKVTQNEESWDICISRLSVRSEEVISANNETHPPLPATRGAERLRAVTYPTRVGKTVPEIEMQVSVDTNASISGFIISQRSLFRQDT